MSSKAAKALAPLNDSVCRALELCEQFDASHESTQRARAQEEAKTILFRKIPRNPQYPAFVNKQSDFYKTFLQLREIVKRNDAILLEERFQNLRRGSQSSAHSRPSFSSSLSSSLPYPLSPQSGGEGGIQIPMPVPNGTHAMNGNAIEECAVGSSSPDRKIHGENFMNHTTNNNEKNGHSAPPLKSNQTRLSGNYEVSVSIVSKKLAVSKVLLVDIRPHDQFEECHINCPLIACIDPSLLKPGMCERDLEDALVISDASEFDSFALRDQVDMLVLYDDNSSSAIDSPALSIVYDTLTEAGRHPYVLKGGFEAWRSYLPEEVSGSGSNSTSSWNNSSSVSFTPPLQRAPPKPPLHKTPFENPYSNVSSRQLPPALPPKESVLTSKEPTQPVPVPSSVPSMSSSSLSSLPSNQSSWQNFQRVPPPLPPQPAPAIPQSHISPNGVGNNTASSSPYLNGTVSRPHPPRTLSGYADSPPKTSLPSLRVPKMLLNPQGRSSSLSPSTSPSKLNGFKTHSLSSSALNNEVVPYTEEKVPPHLLSTTGLKNMGNTCYMNCIIQCLLGVPQLTESFSNGSFVNYINFKSKLGYKGQFASVFANLVRSMTQHQGGFVAPIEIKDLAGELRPDSFAGFEQQDCQEFLTFVLDGLHEDLNLNGDKPKEGELDPRAEEHREAMGIRVASAIEWERYLKGDTSLIVDLFQGQYLSRLQCMSCKKTSTTYNAFSSLSLPIASPKLLGQQTSLKTCFDEFVKPEILDGDNAWFCPHCQKKRRTVKTLQISRLPMILVIHLKRFKRSSLHGVNKLETPVDYPLRNLDLTRYWPQLRQGESSEREAEMLSQIPPRGQTPPFIYDLRAVTLHNGSLKSGHYTSVVQKPGRGWLFYDDANVYPVKEQAAVSKQAYVLFYKRRM